MNSSESIYDDYSTVFLQWPEMTTEQLFLGDEGRERSTKKTDRVWNTDLLSHSFKSDTTEQHANPKELDSFLNIVTWPIGGADHSSMTLLTEGVQIKEVKTSSTPLEESVYWESPSWVDNMVFNSTSTTCSNISSTFSPPFSPKFLHSQGSTLQRSPIGESPKSDMDITQAQKIIEEGSLLDQDRIARVSKRVVDVTEGEADASVHLKDSASDKALISPEKAGSLGRDKLIKQNATRKQRVYKSTLSNTYGDHQSHVPIVPQLKGNKAIWNKIEEKKKKGYYKCGHCDSTFTSMMTLAEHIDEEKIKRPYRCPFNDCPWSILGLPRRAEVRRHCAAQHSTLIDPTKLIPDASPKEPLEFTEAESYQCSSALCQKCFKRRDARLRHEKLVHNNPQSRFNKRLHGLRVKYNTDDVVELAQLIEKLK